MSARCHRCGRSGLAAGGFRCIVFFFVSLLWSGRPAEAHWLPVSTVDVTHETVDYGGECLIIDYSLDVPDLSPDSAAYVFVRYSIDDGAHWALVPGAQLRGDGHDIVTRGGNHTVRWWGSDQRGLTHEGVRLKIAVRAMRMARVAAGTFVAKMIPGGGFDQSKLHVGEAVLPTYHIARFETTIGMYADYLNEVGGNGRGWNKLMADPEQCGIVRDPSGRYVVVPGRENFPINYVSWYEAQSFLDWCGLRLPTELEQIKAFRGGHYLDGDETKQRKNPLPERNFPWGDELPEAGGLLRCNCYVEDRRRQPRTSAVGSFGDNDSPYGVSDLAGNVSEWTLDWHTTAYHESVNIDGYRMIKGGSYLDPGVGCDAIAGASQFPVKRGSSVGFRGVRPAAD